MNSATKEARLAGKKTLRVLQASGKELAAFALDEVSDSGMQLFRV